MTDIRVQVCYATPESHDIRELHVREGATLQFAIEQSGMLRDLPEIDLTVCRVGVYGKLKALDAVLRDGDRVEIYRPLVADPKESRRKRVVKKEAMKNR